MRSRQGCVLRRTPALSVRFAPAPRSASANMPPARTPCRFDSFSLLHYPALLRRWKEGFTGRIRISALAAVPPPAGGRLSGQTARLGHSGDRAGVGLCPGPKLAISPLERRRKLVLLQAKVVSLICGGLPKGLRIAYTRSSLRGTIIAGWKPRQSVSALIAATSISAPMEPFHTRSTLKSARPGSERVPAVTFMRRPLKMTSACRTASATVSRSQSHPCSKSPRPPTRINEISPNVFIYFLGQSLASHSVIWGLGSLSLWSSPRKFRRL